MFVSRPRTQICEDIMPFALRWFGAVIAWLAVSQAISAAERRVSSVTELQRAVADAAPGDRIVVGDGRYEFAEPIVIVAAGTSESPIVITAASIGGVEIRGAAGFRLQSPAAYVVIRGFVFAHRAGELDVAAGVHHCRITRNVFALQVTGRARYLHVMGDDIEIDHNVFRNKDTEGQMVHVQGAGEREMAQRAWIHHNHFHDFRNSRRNNSSALHIGHSARSMTSAYAVVEHNLFARTEGENEGAICNKATDNVYRFNTFGERSSELSLRHGKRCLVYGNFFLGGNGLRFFGHDHRIYSNYFEGCRPAITIGNGGATIPPGPLTSHERPDRVHVVYNTLVDNRSNVQMIGRQNGLGANDLEFSNNIIVGGNKAVSIDGPLANPKWEGNILWNNDGGPGDIPNGGFVMVDPRLARGTDRLYQLADDSPAIGQGVGRYPYVALDIDGQPRGKTPDVGADQFSTERATNRPLAAADVGPDAPEGDRPWISSPTVAVPWIKRP
jgi:poly(beta-D-mannuronate) lyase